MFPVGDTNIRSRGPAYVTWGLILLNTIVFLYELTLSTPRLEQFFNIYAVQPAEIVAGKNLLSLLTSMFLHGGWAHLIGNMLFLWVFGDNIEAVLGHGLYLFFYLAGGLAASFLQIMFDPSSTLPNLGASGAIAAVLGAYIVMFPRSQIKVFYFLGFFFGITRIAAIFFLGIWALMQLFTGLASLGVPTSQSQGGVAVWAHVGGFIFGVVVGFLFRGRARQIAGATYEPPARYY